MSVDKVNRGLADVMIRDPFKKPLGADISDDMPLRLRINALLPPHEKNEPRVAFAQPARRARFVLDAKPTERCCRCKQLVWISPSMKTQTIDFYLCSDCTPPDLLLELQRRAGLDY